MAYKNPLFTQIRSGDKNFYALCIYKNCKNFYIGYTNELNNEERMKKNIFRNFLNIKNKFYLKRVNIIYTTEDDIKYIAMKTIFNYFLKGKIANTYMGQYRIEYIHKLITSKWQNNSNMQNFDVLYKYLRGELKDKIIKDIKYIYQIYNFRTKIMYIGQTNDYNYRISTHFTSINDNLYKYHLKRNDCECKILCICSTTEADEKEFYYTCLRYLQGYSLYNKLCGRISFNRINIRKTVEENFYIKKRYKKKPYCIYEIYNDINDIKYIGKTCMGLKKRFIRHCNGHTRISNAIQKIGKKHFFIRKLKDCLNNDDALKREIETIKEYLDNGIELYNDYIGNKLIKDVYK
jgi:predicted GIY-YIG superfamily endonuclease